MQPPDASPTELHTVNPVDGLWMMGLWAVWSQLAVGAMVTVMFYLSPPRSDPGPVERVFSFVIPVLVGMLIGAMIRDLSWRRMVRRHVEAVHPGWVVPSTPPPKV